MIGQLASRQFLLFLCAGIFAAIINFASRIFFSQWFTYSAAILLAYTLGMVTAYVLSRFFVFTDTSRPLGNSVLMFIFVNIVAIFQTWTISVWLATQVLPWIGIDRYIDEIAHAVGIAVPVFSSYFGHKYFSFSTR